MKRKRYNSRRNIELTVMVMIPLILLIVFKYIPLTGLQIAFRDYDYQNGIFGSEFIGLKNFEFLFKSADAWLITKNTIVMNMLFIVTTTVGGIVFAIFLNEVRSKIAIKTYQKCMFLPHLLSASIITYIVFAFLNPADCGFINSILKTLGKEPNSVVFRAKVLGDHFSFG